MQALASSRSSSNEVSNPGLGLDSTLTVTFLKISPLGPDTSAVPTALDRAPGAFKQAAPGSPWPVLSSILGRKL